MIALCLGHTDAVIDFIQPSTKQIHKISTNKMEATGSLEEWNEIENRFAS